MQGSLTKAHTAPQSTERHDHINGITLIEFLSSTVRRPWLPWTQHQKGRRSFLMTNPARATGRIRFHSLALPNRSAAVTGDQLPSLQPSVALWCLRHLVQSTLLRFNFLCSQAPTFVIVFCSSSFQSPSTPIYYPTFPEYAMDPPLQTLIVKVHSRARLYSLSFCQNPPRSTRHRSPVPHSPELPSELSVPFFECHINLFGPLVRLNSFSLVFIAV